MIFVMCLTYAPKESFFPFSNYKQIDGGATGFLLGSPLANISMCSFDKDSFEIVLMISNLCSIGVMLITYLYCFLPLVM